MRRVNVIVFIIVLLLMGCQNDVLEEQQSDIVTLDWYVNFSWYDTGGEDSLVAQKILEHTGVKVNYIKPEGDENSKLNAMVSLDTLPDILTISWHADQVEQLSDPKYSYALNVLSKSENGNFTRVANPAIIDWYTRDDGNIYCYPNYFFTVEDYLLGNYANSNQVFLVRKDIYRAIGEPDMTTPEGFYNAVAAARDYMPEVDGKPLIPVGSYEFTDYGSASFDEYLLNFLAVPYTKNGEFYDRYADKSYLTWLKMFRQLNQDGYLASNIFTDARQQIEQNVKEGRYFSMLFQHTDIEYQQKYRYVNSPDSIYMAVDGPKNLKGDDYQLPGTGMNGWTVTYISKNCSDPQKALALLTYLMSESGQQLLYLGVEGETFDFVDGQPHLTDYALKLLNTNRALFNASYGAMNKYWMMQNASLQYQWRQPSAPAMKQVIPK